MLTENVPLIGLERLRLAALDLTRDRGLAALSTRSLAAAVGATASAVNHYFDSRGALLLEVAQAAVVESEGWRMAHEAPPFPLPPWSDPASVFVGLLQQRLSDSAPLLALLRELQQDALANDHDEVLKLLSAEVAAEAAYWMRIVIQQGACPEHGGHWADLALGLTGLLLSQRDPELRSVWLSLAANRLQARSDRQPLRFRPGGGEAAEDFALKPPPGNATSARILDCALDEIALKGSARLSQRDVAARAEVSLSAVTYFFGTKRELVAAAFAELYRRHCIAIVENADTSETPDIAVRMMSGFDSRRDMAAMEALFVAAVRSPDLEETVCHIRRTRGVGSFALLRNLGAEVDRIDGFLWVTLLAGQYRRRPGEGEADPDSRSDTLRRLKDLFSVSPGA